MLCVTHNCTLGNWAPQSYLYVWFTVSCNTDSNPDNKVHGTNMVLSAPDGPHNDPMNLAIRGRDWIFSIVLSIKQVHVAVKTWLPMLHETIGRPSTTHKYRIRGASSLLEANISDDFTQLIHVLRIKFVSPSCDIVHRSQGTFYDDSVLVQVMVWHHQTASHYLS